VSNMKFHTESKLVNDKWLQKIWSSDILLEMEEHILISHINSLNIAKQKETLYKWAFPELEESTSSNNPQDTSDNPVDSFIQFLKLFSTGISNQQSGNLDSLWEKMLDSDKETLFKGNQDLFKQWFLNLHEDSASIYATRITSGLTIYPSGVTDFMKTMFDSVTDSEFINVSIINGMLAISCSNIVKLNQIKNMMTTTNAKLHEYRKKVTSDKTIMHTILYKISEM